MNGSNADFAFESDEWLGTISNLQEAQKSMNDTAEAMKETVKNTLLQAGLSGETATALAETYDREILTSVRKFDDSMNEYIQANQTSESNAEQMSEETKRIANTSL